ERVTGGAVLGRQEGTALGAALGLAAEPVDADLRVGLRRWLFLELLRDFLAGLQPLARLLGVGDGAAVTADGAELVWVLQPEHEAAEAAHRQAVDRPPLALGDGAVGGVHVTDQVLDDGVFPVVLLGVVAPGPVDIPGVADVRHDDDEVVGAGVLGHAHPRPGGVVARQAVQQVENRVAIGRLVVPGGQDDVVLHRAADGRAIKRDRFDRWGLGPGVRREQQPQCAPGEEESQFALHAGNLSGKGADGPTLWIPERMQSLGFRATRRVRVAAELCRGWGRLARRLRRAGTAA